MNVKEKKPIINWLKNFKRPWEIRMMVKPAFSNKGLFVWGLQPEGVVVSDVLKEMLLAGAVMDHLRM